MVIDKSRGAKLFEAANTVFLCLTVALTLYPFWSVLVMSLMPYSEAIKTSFYLFPTRVTLDAYRYIMASDRLIRGLGYSVYVTVLLVFYQLWITSMAAYGFTKKDLPGRNALLTLIIITMFFGGGLIPYYLLVKAVGLVDSLWVMVIPAGVNTFHLILIKSFIGSIPSEMEESAIIDGAGFFRIFRSIIVPLSSSVLATVGLFIAVGQWNNWYTPLIFINDREKWPLAMLLREILINNQTGYLQPGFMVNRDIVLIRSVKMGVVIVSIVPIILVYPFIQRYFVKGVMIGAIKS